MTYLASKAIGLVEKRKKAIMPFKVVEVGTNRKSGSVIFEENGRFALLSPLGDLVATYDDHLRFIGECVVDFLLVLIELFFATCYG